MVATVVVVVCWLLVGPVKSSQSVSINSQKERIGKSNFFRWGSSRGECVGLVERRDGCADLLLRRSSLPQPWVSIRAIRLEIVVTLPREREREGGEYISIKDSSLSFSPPFLDFQSIFLVSLDWATSRSKNIIRKREGGGRSITTAHVFFGLFGLSYVCVALFCIKYMSQRDGNRKRPKKKRKNGKQIKNRLWRPTTYPPPPTKILLCLFFFGVCYIPPSKGKRRKKKTSFWLVGFFSGILSLSCVNAKENNNKTRRRAASKKNQTQHTHTKMSLVVCAWLLMCSLSPLYEIEEEEAKGH